MCRGRSSCCQCNEIKRISYWCDPNCSWCGYLDNFCRWRHRWIWIKPLENKYPKIILENESSSPKVILTFVMNFATVTALIDEKYNHPLTPFIVGMTVCQVRFVTFYSMSICSLFRGYWLAGMLVLVAWTQLEYSARLSRITNGHIIGSGGSLK